MVKLRAHDRRTVMVAAGPAAAAYQSVCDETVTPIQIVEAFSKEQPVSVAIDNPSLDVSQDLADPAAISTPPVLDQEEIETAATAVRSAVAAANGALRGANAAAAAIRAVPHIASIRWDNQDGFAGFVAHHPPELTLVRTDSGGWLIDTARRSEEEFRGDSQPDDLPARVSRVPARSGTHAAHFCRSASNP
jgi:hypothetical protein